MTTFYRAMVLELLRFTAAKRVRAWHNYLFSSRVVGNEASRGEERYVPIKKGGPVLRLDHIALLPFFFTLLSYSLVKCLRGEAVVEEPLLVRSRPPRNGLALPCP